LLLIYLSCAWIIGILLGTVGGISPLFLFLAVLPLPFLLLFRRHKKLIITISLLILLLVGGMVRYHSSLPAVDEKQLQFYNDSGIVELRGVINRAPDVRDKTTHLYLSVDEIKIDTDWQSVTGLALVFAPNYPAYDYGDELQVSGKLVTPRAVGDFDYQGYLANQGIYSTMVYPEIEVVATGKGFAPLSWVYAGRDRLSRAMTEVLPEPQASLAQGMILGIKGNISPTLQESFVLSGTAHILIISGSQFNIVAGILVSTGIWLFGKKRYFYVWLALAAIWVYALLTGMSPPVIRSAIMVSLFLAADFFGRQKNVMTSIAFAAAVMIAFTPALLWDASFQLTFMATLGMVLVAPKLQALGRKTISAALGDEGWLVSTANWISDSFFVTLGVTIVIWPILAHYFGMFSLVGTVATLLVLPALPALIVTGSLAASVSIFILFVGEILGWLAWLFASYMLLIINGFAEMPLASVDIGGFDTVWLVVYFIALGIVFWLSNRRKKLSEDVDRVANKLGAVSKRWVVIPLLVLAILTTFVAFTMPDDKFHISFLDVGQGDAILIQTASHQDILVDGGPGFQSISWELGKRLPFWDRTIELVVLTHSHTDHLNGLLEVLQRYRVKQVLYIDTVDDSPQWQEWLKLINEKGIKSTYAHAGQIITLGTEATTIEVINPILNSSIPVGDNGIVLRVSDGKFSFLLTSDITEEAELDIITRRENLTSTVLKVGHHGSNYSSSAEFLAVVEPKLAVISVGADNNYGHPGEETMDRLSDEVGLGNIYRTDENGTVEFITDGERLWVKVDRK
jgi:competence protein ComEC